MKWRRLRNVGSVTMILTFPMFVYESWKSIHLILKNGSKNPLLKNLLTIRWDYFSYSFWPFMTEGAFIVATFLIPYILWNQLNGKPPISRNVILYASSVIVAFWLLMATVLSMNQTQLDVVVGFLAIFALIRPLIFSKKVTSFVDKSLNEIHKEGLYEKEHNNPPGKFKK